MAVTTIHAVRSTLDKAINYIINPHKTEEQKYIGGFNCEPQLADKEFERTRNIFHDGDKLYTRNGSLPILAQHIIQSFSPEDNVTPEQAHEIGKKLMDELCGGKFEYVISTHIDKAHIHNHIIVNNYSFESGHTFHTDLNRGGKIYNKIRGISDKLCEENHLSVIVKPEIGKGRSYYEWEKNKAGNSWKSKLKASIDECIMNADSFEDFLGKIQERGYEIKQGKYISFRAEGQERFTRAKTLGFYYSEENIRFRIDRRLMYREKRQLPKNNLRFVQATEKIKSSEGLQRWAMLQNMKSASKLLNELTERNIESKEDLSVKLLGLYDDRLDVTTEIKSIEKEITGIEYSISTISDYLKLKPIHKQYKSARDPDKFYREHESELRLFDSRKKAVKPLLKDNGKLPNVQDLKKRLAELNEHKAGLIKQYGGIKSEITMLERLKKDLEKYERSVPQKEKVNERE